MLIFLGACAQSGSSTSSDTAGTKSAGAPARNAMADSAAIHATLVAWYSAMQSLDSAGTLAPLTPHFLLLEDTLPLTGPELVARVRKGGTDTKWTAEFSDIRLRFAGDVAWTTLKNHEASVDKSGKRCQADFLETIVFVRSNERWLIDRYHAAALHRWSCG